MVEIQILNPNDQPTGKRRLINELRASLTSNEYDTLLIAVAFVKSGPLLRLQREIESWLAKGKKIESIFGVNHRNTSKQALEFALQKFTRARVLFHSDDFTYHPKMYLFIGERSCRFYIGSHNLTVGGTETNWESGIRVSIQLPEDRETLVEAMQAWNSMQELSEELDTSVIQRYESLGQLSDELARQRRGVHAKPRQGDYESTLSALFRRKFTIKPPSPLPKELFLLKSVKLKSKEQEPSMRPRSIRTVSAEALVIQIVPHHNGEVFLSKIAVDQNPDFFGFPFTGRTVPKKKSNPSYPQREPDPIVDLKVYGTTETPVVRLARYALNTVFYEAKSEIRITVPPQVVQSTPPYSILLIQHAAEDSDCDYEMEIYTSASPKFAEYLAVCNQTLPSGGKATPRRMGWL